MPKVASSRQIKRQARRAASTDPLPHPSFKGKLTTGSESVDHSNDPGKQKEQQEQEQQQHERRGQESLHDNDDDESGGEEGSGQPGQQLSRGQKKRLAKRDKYLRRERMILSSLRLAKQEEQKGRIDGFDSLREALIETATTKTSHGVETHSSAVASSVANTNKAKRRLVADEVEHLDLVLNHPQFAANPFDIMSEHLRNSLADDRRQQELKSRQRAREEKQREEEKMTKKKELLQGYKKKTKKYKPRRTG